MRRTGKRMASKRSRKKTTLTAAQKTRQRIYARANYYKNPEAYKARNLLRSKFNRLVIDAAKANPCSDCERTYPPYVMDFDHVRGKKVTKVARLRDAGTPQLLTEIAKCDLVCANCHRIRTHAQEKAHS